MPADTPKVALDANVPKKHHLDRRSGDLAEKGVGDPDDLLTTSEVAEWLGVSTQFLEIGRHRGYAPRFIRLSTRRVRYRRSDVLAWLDERTHAVTAEYTRLRGPESADAA